jgi:hypothetical protein
LKDALVDKEAVEQYTKENNIDTNVDFSASLANWFVPESSTANTVTQNSPPKQPNKKIKKRK